MTGQYYRQNFIKAIIELSKSKSYQSAIKEWDLVGCSISTGECKDKCICKKAIHNLFEIRNRENNNLTIIGSSCVEHLKSKDIDDKVKILKPIMKEPHLYCLRHVIKKHKKNGNLLCRECVSEWIHRTKGECLDCNNPIDSKYCRCWKCNEILKKENDFKNIIF
tara:strand:- start:1067 stop:1558 length:492 start_codon:yes stop_codon:yes gene_type:complete